MSNPTKSASRFTLRRVLAICWTLGIILACSVPGSSIPNQNLFAYDKVIHVVMFLGLGVLWMYASRRTVYVRTAWVIGGGIAFACLTEVYQGLLPFDRTPDPFDVLADVAGLVIGVGCFFLQRRLR